MSHQSVVADEDETRRQLDCEEGTKIVSRAFIIEICHPYNHTELIAQFERHIANYQRMLRCRPRGFSYFQRTERRKNHER